MSLPIYYDSETCGLHGAMVLLQYAYGDGPIQLHNVWKEPIGSTIQIIEDFMSHPGGVCGFNLAFDHFHLQKIYNLFSLGIELIGSDEIIPEQYTDFFGKIEKDSRDGKCIKPVKALDLMLHARKGEYQSLMARKPIVIRRIPTSLAYPLALELAQRIVLPDIYFAKLKDKSRRWIVRDIKNRDGSINPDFKDLVLDFRSSSSLKSLCGHIFGEDRFGRDRAVFKEIAIDRKYNPEEVGYAPFAQAIERTCQWKKTWPAVIRHHIFHWARNDAARQYAEDDVTDTRNLHRHFGSPDPGDDDSTLACMVGSVRWRGYPIDLKRLAALRDETKERMSKAPTEPKRARQWLMEVLEPMEAAILEVDSSTKKQVLKEVMEFNTTCPTCEGENSQECETCKGTGEVPHPARSRAAAILDARQAKYERNFYNKLLQAGRLHASFEIIGAKSSRMSGRGGDLNSQGIKKAKNVRRCFRMHRKHEVLWGGDFKSFEVTLAEANYNDPVLRQELLSGKKIHALFGTLCFPQLTYDQIVASDGAIAPDIDYYTLAKSGLFALIYGGNEITLMSRLNVTEDAAKAALERFKAKYHGVKAAQDRIENMFCSMRQPNGIGSAVEWHEPADSISSMLGFQRFFTLENTICKALFELGNKPPAALKNTKIKVVRRDRVQTAGGALQSAIYAAAFQIQAANMRAAGNHVIQSSGAQITKAVQRLIWEYQPSGIHDWVVQPMNIHDEILAAMSPEVAEAVAKTVKDAVESYRPIVPLIGIGWKPMKSWASK